MKSVSSAAGHEGEATGPDGRAVGLTGGHEGREMPDFS